MRPRPNTPVIHSIPALRNGLRPVDTGCSCSNIWPFSQRPKIELLEADRLRLQDFFRADLSLFTDLTGLTPPWKWI